MKTKTEIVRSKNTTTLPILRKLSHVSNQFFFFKLTGAAETVLARHRHKMANFIFADFPSPEDKIHHYINKDPVEVIPNGCNPIRKVLHSSPSVRETPLERMMDADVGDDASRSYLPQSHFVFYRAPAHLRANHS